MKHRFFGFVFLLAGVVLGPRFLADAVAEPEVFGRPPPASLREGMDFAEVVRVLGIPDERFEYEIKRENLWIYPKFRVLFKEGRLSSWASNQQPAEKSTQTDRRPQPDRVKAGSKEKEENVVEEILTEIMKSS